MKPFEHVIDQHGPAILRYCAGRVGPERAEDCFQETMLAALRSYEKVRDEKAVKAWLFKIATRKSIDIYRSHAKQDAPAGQLDPVESRRKSDQPGHSDVWSVVDHLPDKQRDAIYLRFQGGLNHREVGVVMGISESAARRNGFEGLKRLRSESGSWS